MEGFNRRECDGMCQFSIELQKPLFTFSVFSCFNIVSRVYFHKGDHSFTSYRQRSNCAQAGFQFVSHFEYMNTLDRCSRGCLSTRCAFSNHHLTCEASHRVVGLHQPRVPLAQRAIVTPFPLRLHGACRGPSELTVVLKAGEL